MTTPNTLTEKHLIFMLNGKSSAKSTNLITIVPFLTSRQIDLQLIEGDTVTMGLSNFHSAPLYDVTTRDGMKRLLDDVRRSAKTLFGIDTPASKTRELMALLCPLADLQKEYQKQTGIGIIGFVSMTANDDSVYQAQIICDHLARTSAKIVLALNNFPTDVIEIYERSEIKKILAPKIERGEAVVITIPACPNAAALARLWELGLDAHAVQGKPCDVMEPFDQADLYVWYSQVCAQYERILGLILPKGQVPTAVEAQPVPETLLDIAALKQQRRKERAEETAS